MTMKYVMQRSAPLVIAQDMRAVRYWEQVFVSYVVIPASKERPNGDEMQPQYVLTAHCDGDTWSYGPFSNEQDAERLGEQLAQRYLTCDYSVGELFAPDDCDLERELANG